MGAQYRINAQLALYKYVTGEHVHEWMQRLEATRREVAAAAADAAGSGKRSQHISKEKLLPPGVLQAESTLGTHKRLAARMKSSALTPPEGTTARWKRVLPNNALTQKRC